MHRLKKQQKEIRMQPISNNGRVGNAGMDGSGMITPIGGVFAPFKTYCPSQARQR
jgi:hypothetical protein